MKFKTQSVQPIVSLWFPFSLEVVNFKTCTGRCFASGVAQQRQVEIRDE